MAPTPAVRDQSWERRVAVLQAQARVRSAARRRRRRWLSLRRRCPNDGGAFADIGGLVGRRLHAPRHVQTVFSFTESVTVCALLYPLLGRLYRGRP